MRVAAVRRIYWVATTLFVVSMLASGVQDVRRAPEILEAITRLGYPPYMLSMLGVAKLAGAPLLLVCRLPRLREWAYAGFTFNLSAGAVSHITVGDTFAQTLPALACLALLATSYIALRARA